MQNEIYIIGGALITLGLLYGNRRGIEGLVRKMMTGEATIRTRRRRDSNPEKY